MSKKQQAHSLIEQLDPGQLTVAVHLLEVMVRDDDELSEEDRLAVAASREYFLKGNEGYSIEQIAAEGGLTLEQILNHKAS